MAHTRAPVLKTLQFTLRALQLTASIIILSLTSYLLAALSNRSLPTPTYLRAVEGIAGITVLYCIGTILLLRIVVGRMVSSFAIMVLDVAFAGAAIYVATANKYGAGGCSGEVDGPFGKGKAGDHVEGGDGFVTLPSYGSACRIGSAGLGVSIILIFLFIASIFTELSLGRDYQRQKRQNLINPPDKASTIASIKPKTGFFSFLLRRKNPTPVHPDNTLPQHTRPTQLPERNSYATVAQEDHLLTYPQPTGTRPERDEDALAYHGTGHHLGGSAVGGVGAGVMGYDNGRYGDGGVGYTATGTPPQHGNGNGNGNGIPTTPYGEVPDAGGDLGYGVRHSIYGTNPTSPYAERPSPYSAQPSPYGESPYSTDHSWRPSERFSRQPSRPPPGYLYEDGLYERP